MDHSRRWISRRRKNHAALSAARELESRSLRSAVILNDLGEGLVDAELASLRNIRNGQVTASYFCCRFLQLVEVMDHLRQYAPDVIFAEQLGSCTDISATTLHPLTCSPRQGQISESKALPSCSSEPRPIDSPRGLVLPGMISMQITSYRSGDQIRLRKVPPMSRLAPVMNFASGDARKTTA